jgi:hypothetical protein
VRRKAVSCQTNIDEISMQRLNREVRTQESYVAYGWESLRYLCAASSVGSDTSDSQLSSTNAQTELPLAPMRCIGRSPSVSNS